VIEIDACLRVPIRQSALEVRLSALQPLRSYSMQPQNARAIEV
jgi:hypothetical protein